MRVRVFLRQTLFTLPGTAAHIPAKTAIIEGMSVDPSTASLRVMAELYLDDKGKILEGVPCDLFIPEGKIDHIVVLP